MPCGRITLRACGVVASFMLLVAVAACGTPTSTTQLWQAQGIVRAPMRHMVVFANGTSETGRRTLEDKMVAALAGRGVDAKPSYAVFPTMPEREAARGALQSGGYDGAMMVSVRSTRERPEYVPAGPAYDGFWDGASWGALYSPGYIVTDELVNIETKVWDLRANGAPLVWSATTQTTNPSSAGDEAKSLTKEILPKLSEGGIIPPKP